MEQRRDKVGRSCSAREADASVPVGSISRKRRAPPGRREQDLWSHEMSASRALNDDVTGAGGATVEARPRQPPPLNADLLLEIVARTDDPATVVRCAAASKPLRRAILDPGFRRRLELRAAANGGFDPALLVAVSYRLRDSDAVVVLPSRRLSFADLLRSFKPVSSRNGLVVLCGYQRRPGIDLRVYNTVTGHVVSLPTMDDEGFGGDTTNMFPPALLSIDDGGRSLELLVMYQHCAYHDRHLEIHTISSHEAKWSAVRNIPWPQGAQQYMNVTSPAPAVIERSVHWLCITSSDSDFRSFSLVILTLHTKPVQATVIKPPQECLASIGRGYSGAISRTHCLILAATAEGKRLSLVIAEKLVISLWTLLPEEGSSSWSRQVVIRRREIDSQLATVLDSYQPIRFDVFGERSGTVLFWMECVGLVQLNLGTKKAVVLWRCSDPDPIRRWTARAFLHEIDLVPFLQCMKHY